MGWVTWRRSGRMDGIAELQGAPTLQASLLGSMEPKDVLWMMWMGCTYSLGR